VPINEALVGYAEAVHLGRHGGPADAAFDDAEAAVAGLDMFAGLLHLGRRLAAEAALRDGWGDPVVWLRSAAAFFADSGHQRVAAACRSLLQTAGAPVPRRGRGNSPVPQELRGAGVTSRETDVLTLVGAGMSNVEIAGRLYLSPRTVETHIGRLLAKTGRADRAELVALAIRLELNYGSGRA
jgi:DNA-binding CsgD family transcriptional regulator